MYNSGLLVETKEEYFPSLSGKTIQIPLTSYISDLTEEPGVTKRREGPNRQDSTGEDRNVGLNVSVSGIRSGKVRRLLTRYTTKDTERHESQTVER